MNMTGLLRTIALATVTAAAAMLVATCGNEPDPVEVESPAAVAANEALRLRLNPVPAGFEVVTNEADQLVLSPSDATIEGQVFFRNRPPEAGQNLPYELKAHQVFIENQEGGEYQGGQELVSQLGTTFYSRGRYLSDGAEIEETVIFALHPEADRMINIVYRYPAGVDSSIRVQQLFEVLASVEGTR